LVFSKIYDFKRKKSSFAIKYNDCEFNNVRKRNNNDNNNNNQLKEVFQLVRGIGKSEVPEGKVI
jgi:hypothetical protein